MSAIVLPSSSTAGVDTQGGITGLWRPSGGWKGERESRAVFAKKLTLEFGLRTGGVCRALTTGATVSRLAGGGRAALDTMALITQEGFRLMRYGDHRHEGRILGYFDRFVSFRTKDKSDTAH